MEIEKGKKLTNRAKQAIATKNLILSEGKKLILKKGYNSVTVDEISRKANITVGTFYHYFHSKEDLIISMMPQITDLKEQFASYKDASSYQKIVRYFTWFNEEIERTKISNDLICQLFSSQKTSAKLEEERILFGIELMVEGQLRGEITKEYQPAYISRLIFAATRGICFLWALHPNSINLTEATYELVTRLVRSFLVEDKEEPAGPG